VLLTGGRRRPEAERFDEKHLDATMEDELAAGAVLRRLVTDQLDDRRRRLELARARRLRQDEERLFARGESIGGRSPFVARDAEAATFQDTQGSDVASGSARVERPSRHLFEEQPECARRYPSAPMFACDPVADGILAFIPRARDRDAVGLGRWFPLAVTLALTVTAGAAESADPNDNVDTEQRPRTRSSRRPRPTIPSSRPRKRTLPLSTQCSRRSVIAGVSERHFMPALAARVRSSHYRGSTI
jgi:hypothetical protein